LTLQNRRKAENVLRNNLLLLVG